MHRRENNIMTNGGTASGHDFRRAPPPRTSTNDEAMLLLQDRQKAAIDLNFLLQRAMDDEKIAIDYQSFRARYLRALGKFRPSEYELEDDYDFEEEELEEDFASELGTVKKEAIKESLREKRLKEKEKKEQCSHLQNAWLLYDALATDKPEMLSKEEEQFEKDMDDFERDLFEEWHDFAEDVIARAEFENDTSKDILDWHLELKEIRRDLKQIKRRSDERAETRRRALRRIHHCVRAARRGSAGSGYDDPDFEDEEGYELDEEEDDDELEAEAEFHEEEPTEVTETTDIGGGSEDESSSKKSSNSSKSSKSPTSPTKSEKRKKHERENTLDKLSEISEHDPSEGLLSKNHSKDPLSISRRSSINSSHSRKSSSSKKKKVDKLSGVSERGKDDPLGSKSSHSVHSSMSRKKEKKERKRRREKRQARLLREVFPPHVAKALRQGRKVEPESKECVTIFFSDIVGFTHISSALSPLKVCDMLDRLYEKFDALSLEHEVYKVETIGDSWMGVTNLIKVRTIPWGIMRVVNVGSLNQEDHAKRIALFALDAMKASKETWIDEEDHSWGKVNLRVGFHSGPVVANVVGSVNPRYCLFGDTVNTASRMESHSLPGRIHCSAMSARNLKKDTTNTGLYLFSRGEIEVKGKGLMETFFIRDVDTPYKPETSDPEVPPISPQKVRKPYRGKSSKEYTKSTKVNEKSTRENAKRPERHRSMARNARRPERNVSTISILSPSVAIPELKLLYLDSDDEEEEKTEYVPRRQACV
eukprot:scaffold1586_cov158-Amphora_coffeaeformis.AAC.11